MHNILAFLLSIATTFSAVSPGLVGGLRINNDTTNTNTTSAKVTVTASTNLNAGTVQATNSVNVGRAGEAGVITLTSTNGTYSVTLSVASDGTLQLRYGTTNMLTLLVGANAANNGSPTNFLTAAGYYTNAGAALNPTAGYLPYNSNGVLFADSPLLTSGGSVFNTNSAVAVFKTQVGADDHILLLVAPGINTDASIQGTVGGTLRYFLEPNVDNGLSALAYKFDTVNVLTGADAVILGVAHSGTNYVQVVPSQASTNTPLTLNINGTVKRVHVGAADSAGTGLSALAVEN